MKHEFKFKFQIGKAPSTLIATIGPNGDTPDAWTGKKVEIKIPDTTDIPNCIEFVKNAPPVDGPLLPVPEGLAQCSACGEHRGVMALRDVPDPRGVNQDENPDTPLRVQCICDGIQCPRCKINRFHRPISNVWSERGGFLHVPYFSGLVPMR